jgi:hypothetical protein
MSNNNFQTLFLRLFRLVGSLVILVVILFVGTVYYTIDPSFSSINEVIQDDPIPSLIVDQNLIENGVHVQTGLKEGKGLMLVVQNCTSCHSAKMITQNRATKEGWQSMIKWMQQTQGLWKLGANEDKIIDYLATQYAPQKKGRRQRLTNIEWYDLK